jgi:arsenate reductase
MTTLVIQPQPLWAGAVALLQSAGLPVADLTAAHLDHFFYCGPAAQPNGLVGLEIYDQHALLRSLVVTPTLRSSGLGSALLEHAESHAKASGAHSIFLLTTTAEPFFRRHGYVPVDRASAPAPIRATREFADICPASSAFMMKHLERRPAMSTVVIYHNPDCGTSRNTLAMIRNAGIEPTVIEYLRNPPSREQLATMIAAAGLTVRQALREKCTPYQELGLANPTLTDAQLLDAMLAHPILINRPFVVTPQGTRLCRPSEVVLEILPASQQGYFAKEDGEVVINQRGQRVDHK